MADLCRRAGGTCSTAALKNTQAALTLCQEPVPYAPEPAPSKASLPAWQAAPCCGLVAARAGEAAPELTPEAVRCALCGSAGGASRFASVATGSGLAASGGGGATTAGLLATAGAAAGLPLSAARLEAIAGLTRTSCSFLGPARRAASSCSEGLAGCGGRGRRR